MKLLLNYLSTIRVEQSWNEMQTFRTLERGLNQDKKDVENFFSLGAPKLD